MLGKVKSKKQKARLDARIAAWDKIPNKVGKSGRNSHTKPGSNKK